MFSLQPIIPPPANVIISPTPVVPDASSWGVWESLEANSGRKQFRPVYLPSDGGMPAAGPNFDEEKHTIGQLRWGGRQTCERFIEWASKQDGPRIGPQAGKPWTAESLRQSYGNFNTALSQLLATEKEELRAGNAMFDRDLAWETMVAAQGYAITKEDNEGIDRDAYAASGGHPLERLATYARSSRVLHHQPITAGEPGHRGGLPLDQPGVSPKVIRETVDGVPMATVILMNAGPGREGITCPTFSPADIVPGTGMDELATAKAFVRWADRRGFHSPPVGDNLPADVDLPLGYTAESFAGYPSDSDLQASVAAFKRDLRAVATVNETFAGNKRAADRYAPSEAWAKFLDGGLPATQAYAAEVRVTLTAAASADAEEEQAIMDDLNEKRRANRAARASAAAVVESAGPLPTLPAPAAEAPAEAVAEAQAEVEPEEEEALQM